MSTSAPSLLTRVDHACEQACAAIAPSWPLDQSMAINPHFKRIDRSVRQVAARMAVFGAGRVYPTRAYFRHAWENGHIQTADVQAALVELQTDTNPRTLQDCVQALNNEAHFTPLPLLMDILDDDPQRQSRMHWRAAITHQISQTCAAYFDEHQALWQPTRQEGLYSFWRQTLMADHGIATLMGLPHLSQVLSSLPTTATEARSWVIHRLGLPSTVWADYLEAVLLTIQGWASWCAYLQWQAQLKNQSDSHLMELLSIRLAWGVLLLECKGLQKADHAFLVMQQQWQTAEQALAHAEDTLWIDELWQTALDHSYQRTLHAGLTHQPMRRDDPSIPEVTAVFCMDVRSEPIRHALEAAHPHLSTRGFAGFFGLPLTYQPLGAQDSQAYLPGLLSPSIHVTDTVRAIGETSVSPHSALTVQHHETQIRQQTTHRPWHAASQWPISAFTYVEALGVAYLPRLLRWMHPQSKSPSTTASANVCQPTLIDLTLRQKTALAKRVLAAMQLTQPPPLVVLVGHASESLNNAHASALNCGACGGQSGLLNARVLAQLLNDPDVRAELRLQGVDLPAETFFIAALHNTTTETITLADHDLTPAIHQTACQSFERACQTATEATRRQRASRLGLNPQQSARSLEKKFIQRATDVAMTRPEWGLLNNAALLIAPRSRSQSTDWQGRIFMLEYDAQQDTTGEQLEALMTAPMVVAHWINWQYHASTCDPVRFGSGNKLLHNVVGGRIGVFEGNGGDLRIGLSRQSLHNGKQWCHEPLRLTVVIDAAPERIARIIDAHSTLRHLVHNRWLSVWCMTRTRDVLCYVPAADKLGSTSWHPWQSHGTCAQ